ncbi:MAG TPA: hypothetical protein VKE74_09375 [Gemmataceae bacterium]|nr:hypothetical protein [Gemmataceae bacterium]
MARRSVLAVVALILALAVAAADDKKGDKTKDDDKTKKVDDKKVDDKKKDDKTKDDDKKKVDDKKPEPKTAFTNHDGYYEKNTSGLTGPSSYLVFTSFDGFDKVFAAVPPPGVPDRKPVTKETFDTKLVVAAIKRGQYLWNYEFESVTAEGGTLTVRYKAVRGGFQGGATFASSMILSTDKAGIKKVVFVENGATVSTVEVK